MLERSVLDFLKMAADKTPVPGGGAVAALAGALGCSMGHMAAVFTTSDKYSDVKEHIEQIIKSMADGLGEFAQAVEADAAAYAEYNAAMKMPKGTVAEKAKRQAAMQLTLGNAVQVPRKVCSLALDGLKAMRILVEIGNPNLVSDVSVAAIMLKAAFDAGRVNVLVNIAMLKDNPAVQQLRGAVDAEATQVDELSSIIRVRSLERIFG